MKNLRLATLVVATAFAAPATASADNIVVGGTVGSSLSISVPTPSDMTLVPSSTLTSSSSVAVVSTLPSWTMTIADTNTGTGAGRMKLAGVATYLTNALEWRVDGAGAWTSLTGTAATATTGALTQTKVVNLRQTTVAADVLTAGQIWALTAQIVVS